MSLLCCQFLHIIIRSKMAVNEKLNSFVCEYFYSFVFINDTVISFDYMNYWRMKE
jgi:hypothetical protein